MAAGDIECEVAIIGAGFSGTLTAVNLARCGCRSVVLIEARDRFARGVAYSTRDQCHLLNVRAGNMSAFPGEPGHFASWLEARGLGDGASFAPRRCYGRYLSELIEEAVQSGAVRLVGGEALSLAAAPGEARVGLSGGRSVRAQAAVLAAGNLPPHPLRPISEAGVSEAHYVNDPWSAAGMAAIDRISAEPRDVLVLGTGLTMVDVVLSLAERGFAGRAVAVSRRGLMPRAHAGFAPAPLSAAPPARLDPLLRLVRLRAAEVGWRAAVDSLRPFTVGLWQGAGEAERRRFLRHLRPYWDVHRHRIAPAVAARFAELEASGKVELIAGRLVAVEAGAGGVHATVSPRGGGPARRLEVGAIVNCTGPQGDIRRSRDPLVRQLLADGTARPDPLGLGFDVDPDSRVIGSDGSARANLYAVGPLTKGAFWEIVAVPDIRGQVSAVARALAPAP